MSTLTPLGYRLTTDQPAEAGGVALAGAADGGDPELDAALQELADVLDGEPLSTEQP